MYTCGICEKEYETITERNKCEASCIKHVEAEAKKAAEAKKREEQMARKEELDDAVSYTKELFDAYVKDFGAYEFQYDAAGSWIWPTKLFSFFI